MIIIPWTQIGKERLASAKEDFAYLRSPDRLGQDWPNIESAEQALSFLCAHESRAAMDLEFNLLGGFGLRSEADNGDAWLYFFLLPAHQGQGLGAVLLAKAIDHAQLDAARKTLYARCAKGNLRSLHALEAAGFHECMHLRKPEHLIYCRALNVCD